MSESENSLTASSYVNAIDMDVVDIRDGLKNLLSNVGSESQRIAVNTYMVRFLLKGQKDNVSIPLTLQDDMINSIYNNLSSHKNDACGKYDPTSEEVGKYVVLPVSEIAEKWDKLVSLINERIDAHPAVNRLSEANLCLIDLEYNGRKYYICLCQNALSGLYKGKKLYWVNEATVKPCQQNNYFLFSAEVTFVVTQINNNMVVYIFNQKKFNSFFKYDEYLKDYAKENLQTFKELSIVNTWDELDKKIERQYVYSVVAKVLKDEEYLGQIRKVNLRDFKARILQKQETPVFSEDDFTAEGKIKLTKENFKAFMNIIGKKNRYNYFTDIAEG